MSLIKAVFYNLVYMSLPKDAVACLLVVYTKTFELDANKNTIIDLFDRLTKEGD